MHMIDKKKFFTLLFFLFLNSIHLFYFLSFIPFYRLLRKILICTMPAYKFNSIEKGALSNTNRYACIQKRAVYGTDLVLSFIHLWTKMVARLERSFNKCGHHQMEHSRWKNVINGMQVMLPYDHDEHER